MTAYTPAQAREDADDIEHCRPVYDISDALRSLADDVEALTATNAELEMLCDATYVAKGADAYNHATDRMEQWQGKRTAEGKDTGTTHSLCDGIEWLYERVSKLEEERDAFKAQAIKFNWVLEALTNPTDCEKELRLFAAIDRLDIHGLTPIELVAYLDTAISDAMKEPK